MSLTNTYENSLLDHLAPGNTASPLFPNDLARYAALFTADPTEAGTVTSEVSGGAYNRVDTDTLWAAASGGSISTNAAITFPTATADWAAGGTTIGYCCLMASGTPTTADMVIRGALTTARNVLNGDTFQIASGNYTITAD